MRSVLRGVLHLLGGQALRLVSQSLLLLLLARGLGAESFSKITAMLTLILALSPFTSLGAPVQVVRGVARNPSERAIYWGRGLFVTSLLGFLVSILLVFVAPRVLGIDFPALPLLLYATSELVVFGIINTLNAVLQAEERLGAIARIQASLSIIRLAIMAALFFSIGLDLLSFAYAQFAGAAITLIVALFIYGRAWGRPQLPTRMGELAQFARDGLSISIAGSGRNFLLGLDKMMLPSMFGLLAAAQYAAGFRVVMFAYIPLQALLVALYPRFFRKGGRSLNEGLALWRRIAPYAAAYAVIAGVALFALAPFIQILLGEEFPESAAVIRALVGLLLIQALYVPLGDALSGADHLAYRAGSFVVAVICNLGLNLWLIPEHGWHGAVIAAYLSHGVLFILYIIRAWRSTRA